MLSLQECLDFCPLSDEEIAIVAAHLGVPEMTAAARAGVLMASPKGIFTIKQWMLEELDRAAVAGDLARERQLRSVYTRFNAAHPTPRVL